MEYMPGGDLLHYVVEHGKLLESQARRLFAELCRATLYLHTRNIVHRDFKLENLLLTSKCLDEAHLKIADFGISRRVLQSRDCRTFCGTIDYSAPEVVRLRPPRAAGTASN